MYYQNEINICVTDDDSEVDLEDDSEIEGKILFAVLCNFQTMQKCF